MNPDTVEALLFDMGGVVLEVDFDGIFDHLSKNNTPSASEIRQSFSMDDAYEQHEKGLITGAQYFSHLRKTLNLSSDDSLLIDSWNAIFGNEITAVLDAIEQLGDRYPCYAFTNTNAIHQAYWEKEFPRIRQCFDYMFVSSEMGLRKPDAEAFNFILNETSIKAESMLFFDDSYTNIEGALNAGLQAVHVTSPQDVILALEALPK
ncbi:MAG: HAD family hydrolase [Granulosicoccus sp.]